VTIPRIFHYLWTSGDELPETVLAARQTWIDRHPDWEFRVWRPEDLPWLRNRALFDRAKTYAQKADIARYEVVHRYGGVYLDTDMECLRPLGSILNGCEFFAGREPRGSVAIGIFGAVPSHPILRQTIERLPASCFLNPAGPINVQTGPLLLHKALRDGEWEQRKGVCIYPSPYFYPYAGGQPWRADEAFPRAYAVHRWNNSWKGQRAVKGRPADLLPRRGEAILPFARALWREASGHAAMVTERRLRERLVWPTKRFARGVVQRVLPTPPILHGVPWGAGEILVETRFGARLLCSTEDLSLAPELALTGEYDRPFATLLEQRLRWGMSFVDVGANVGLFTMLAASRVGPAGGVFAYECNPELIGLLRRNVEMNWLDNRVRIIPKAAHRDDETRLLRVPRNQKMLGSLTRFNEPKVRAVGLQEFHVECERIDSGLEGVRFIDLLRIDVEGGEGAVLDGISGLLDEGRVGVIVMDYRDKELGEELQQDLEKQLTSFVQDKGASLHVPFDPRSIPLDEVFTVFQYPHLLIRFPGASIDP
jgi:FkbM family methyltransferase